MKAEEILRELKEFEIDENEALELALDELQQLERERPNKGYFQDMNTLIDQNNELKAQLEKEKKANECYRKMLIDANMIRPT
jgi:hypothetical protein